jgi:hypothetical protein
MDGADNALEREHRLNQLYLGIISRYKEYIEEMEHISIAELPSLVTPKKELIVKKADEIKNTFEDYSFDIHFYEASINAFAYVRDSVLETTMPVQFWLTAEDTLKFGIGDTIDRNILLCSLLSALGNPSARVLVSIRGDIRKILTYYELNKRVYILDLSSGFHKLGSKEILIKSLNLDEKSTAYEFNEGQYNEIA